MTPISKTAAYYAANCLAILDRITTPEAQQAFTAINSLGHVQWECDMQNDKVNISPNIESSRPSPSKPIYITSVDQAVVQKYTELKAELVAGKTLIIRSYGKALRGIRMFDPEAQEFCIALL